MGRPHTLVEYRVKEFELEQALRGLQQQREGLDYQLDLEFYQKLDALAKEYEFSLSEVFDLLASRYEGEAPKGGLNEASLRARTTSGVLELIRTLEGQSEVSSTANIHTSNEEPA